MSRVDGVLKCLPYVDCKDQAGRLVAGCSADVTLKWIKRGFYRDERGERVSLTDAVQAARSARVVITGSTGLPVPRPPGFPVTRVQVSNETATDSAWRLLEYGLDPLVIRWIDGQHSGNDDLLYRSSALQALLMNNAAPITGDDAVLSPIVPVFRSTSGSFLPEPWFLNVLTSASPCSNLPAQNGVHRLLAIARAYGYSTLIWDGSTRTSTDATERLRTATLFREALEGEFNGCFGEVMFCLADPSPGRDMLKGFRAVMEHGYEVPVHRPGQTMCTG